LGVLGFGGKVLSQPINEHVLIGYYYYVSHHSIRNVGAKLLKIPTRTKRRIRNIRNFLVVLGLVAVMGTKGRAFIYDWNRNRQRQMEEESKRKRIEKKKQESF